jgi:hypothetical protein
VHLTGVYLTDMHLTSVYLARVSHSRVLRAGHGWRESLYRHPECFEASDYGRFATHHPGCSPSAQAPSFSSSDNPIMWSPTCCPVMSLSSTLHGGALVPSFGTQGRRNGNPPKPRTYTHGRDRITSLGSMLEMKPPLLERRSAARSLYMMPSPLSAVAVLLS